MLLQAVLFCIGLIALYFGAEWLVRGASRLALAAGVSGLVVGLTVVAFGTSAPELVVSTLASFEGSPAVAVGNVVGSNILNIALILGVASLIRPLRVELGLLLRETPIMIAAALSLPIVAADGVVSRGDGAALLAGFGAYLAYAWASAHRTPAEAQPECHAPGAEEELAPAAGSRLRDWGLVAGGLAGLVVGAQLLVESAVYFARAVGVSELVVGVTVVALGTSLPELATSVVAALRRETDIALGNIIGSNIFNSLAILGAAAMVGPLAASHAVLTLEVPVMVGVSVLFLPLAYTRSRLDRWEGALLVGSYVGFTVLLILRGVGPS